MSSRQPDLKHVEKHSKYFLDGGDLYLMVENTIFCVHSYFFKRESPRLREKISTTLVSGQPRTGKGSEDSPICIPNTTPVDFATFLWVFYNEKFGDYQTSVANWTVILKIACDLEFPEVKHLAIRSLEKCDLSVAHRINIYQTYNADQSYIIPLFVALCVRTEGPTDDETDLIGIKTSLVIFRARERLRAPSSSKGTSRPSAIDEVGAAQVVCEVLGYNNSRIGNSSAAAIGSELAIDKSDKGKAPKPNGSNIRVNCNGNVDKSKKPDA